MSAVAYEVKLERFRAARSHHAARGEEISRGLRGKWKAGEMIALAKTSCCRCRGVGTRRGRWVGSLVPCNCVLRAVFRACLERYQRTSSKEKYMSKTSLGWSSAGGKDRGLRWERMDEDYLADFWLMAKRTLDREHWEIFRLHYVGGADWRACCRALKIDRGNFFHCCYRIEQQMGRVFRETEPYSLFPLDEYFSPVVRRTRPEVLARTPITPGLIRGQDVASGGAVVNAA